LAAGARPSAALAGARGRARAPTAVAAAGVRRLAAPGPASRQAEPRAGVPGMAREEGAAAALPWAGCAGASPRSAAGLSRPAERSSVAAAGKRRFARDLFRAEVAELAWPAQSAASERSHGWKGRMEAPPER
jgi:hypothetical protein